MEPSKATLAEYLTGEWPPSLGNNVRPATYATYEPLVRTHLAAKGTQGWVARSGAPTDVDLTQVKRFFVELERTRLSAETRRLIHSVLRKALSDAVETDRITRNPVERVKRPETSDRRATACTGGEPRRFLAQAENDRLYALWRLDATTGMRRGECLGLTWRSLDGCRLSMTRQMLATGAFGPPKTKRSDRTITLDPATVGALEQHREAQLVERALAGDSYQDQDLVFCHELGNPIPPYRLSGQFHRLRKAAGIPTGSMHILRHTATTLMLTNREPLHVVAARLGDRAETLLRVYAHLLPQSDATAAEGMAGIIASDG